MRVVLLGWVDAHAEPGLDVGRVGQPPIRGLVAARDPAAARTGHRPALFSESDGAVDTPVYEMSRLAPGNAFAGPALIESDDTTVVVAPGWSCEVDERSAIVLTHDQEPEHV